MRCFKMRPMRYQPIVICTQPTKVTTIGFEALYNHPNNYRIFSENNLELERDCLFSAIAEAVKNGLAQRPDLKLFVNASMNAIWEFRDEISTLTLKHLLPGQLVVEITEQPYHGPLDLMYRIIEDIRQRGWLVAIDDFGTGQSYKLTGAEVDYIKADMSMIRNCNHSLDKQKTLKALVGLYGKEKVIAEGVETVDECATCYQTGITIMQGYFFSYPGELPPNLKDPALINIDRL